MYVCMYMHIHAYTVCACVRIRADMADAIRVPYTYYTCALYVLYVCLIRADMADASANVPGAPQVDWPIRAPGAHTCL